jgi:hypothetical protein
LPFTTTGGVLEFDLAVKLGFVAEIRREKKSQIMAAAVVGDFIFLYGPCLDMNWNPKRKNWRERTRDLKMTVVKRKWLKIRKVRET